MTQNLLPYQGNFSKQIVRPKISSETYVAPNAFVIGDVEIGEKSGIWFGCTVRGDVNHIRIGKRTNIQDNTAIHVTRHTGPTIIGDDVTIGHACVLHACTLESACFIGMGALVMDEVVVETGAMVAAGSLVTPGKRIPKGQLWAGRPAKFFRELTEEEARHILVSASNYVELAEEYLALTPLP